MRSISSSTIHSVRIARFSTEVKAWPNSNPCARSNTPAARASSRPCAVRSTSVQPVKRFSRFQALWPWRTKTSRLCTRPSSALDQPAQRPHGDRDRREVGAAGRAHLAHHAADAGDGCRRRLRSSPQPARARRRGPCRRARGPRAGAAAGTAPRAARPARPPASGRRPASARSGPAASRARARRRGRNRPWRCGRSPLRRNSAISTMSTPAWTAPRLATRRETFGGTPACE